MWPTVVLYCFGFLGIYIIGCTNGQSACTCTDLNTCIQQQEQQFLTAAGNCRSQCQIMLGPTYGTAASQCFAEKETQIMQVKSTLRNCIESRTGQPCVGPAGPQEQGNENANSNSNSSSHNGTRKKRAPPPVIVLPPNVRNFIICYASCQRQAFALAVMHSEGRGGIYGYPGCARMMNCVLVRPTNFTAGLAAQVDCTIQAGARTQLVYQTFCQCLKTAFGPDSQFLNCDVYGTPTENSPSETTEAPAEFLRLFEL